MLTSWVIDGLGLPLKNERQHGGQPSHHLLPGIHQVPQLSVRRQTLREKQGILGWLTGGKEVSQLLGASAMEATFVYCYAGRGWRLDGGGR